jgi:hypothetical protein
VAFALIRAFAFQTLPYFAKSAHIIDRLMYSCEGIVSRKREAPQGKLG